MGPLFDGDLPRRRYPFVEMYYCATFWTNWSLGEDGTFLPKAIRGKSSALLFCLTDQVWQPFYGFFFCAPYSWEFGAPIGLLGKEGDYANGGAVHDNTRTVTLSLYVRERERETTVLVLPRTYIYVRKRTRAKGG